MIVLEGYQEAGWSASLRAKMSSRYPRVAEHWGKAISGFLYEVDHFLIVPVVDVTGGKLMKVDGE
jgi:hypothetical protein